MLPREATQKEPRHPSLPKTATPRIKKKKKKNFARNRTKRQREQKEPGPAQGNTMVRAEGTRGGRRKKSLRQVTGVMLLSKVKGAGEGATPRDLKRENQENDYSIRQHKQIEKGDCEFFQNENNG